MGMVCMVPRTLWVYQFSPKPFQGKVLQGFRPNPKIPEAPPWPVWAAHCPLWELPIALGGVQGSAAQPAGSRHYICALPGVSTARDRRMDKANSAGPMDVGIKASFRTMKYMEMAALLGQMVEGVILPFPGPWSLILVCGPW